MASTEGVKKHSIYDYPEHLNPFHEEDNHSRIRFWTIRRKPGRSNSFSFSSLKDIRNTLRNSFRRKNPNNSSLSSPISCVSAQNSPEITRRKYPASLSNTPTLNRNSSISQSQVDTYAYGGSITPLPRSRFHERTSHLSTGREVGSPNKLDSPSHRGSQPFALPGLSDTKADRSSRTSLQSNPFDDFVDTPVRTSTRKKRKAPLPPPTTLSGSILPAIPNITITDVSQEIEISSSSAKTKLHKDDSKNYDIDINDPSFKTELRIIEDDEKVTVKSEAHTKKEPEFKVEENLEIQNVPEDTPQIENKNVIKIESENMPPAKIDNTPSLETENKPTLVIEIETPINIEIKSDTRVEYKSIEVENTLSVEKDDQLNIETENKSQLTKVNELQIIEEGESTLKITDEYQTDSVETPVSSSAFEKSCYADLSVTKITSEPTADNKDNKIKIDSPKILVDENLNKNLFQKVNIVTYRRQQSLDSIGTMQYKEREDTTDNIKINTDIGNGIEKNGDVKQNNIEPRRTQVLQCRMTEHNNRYDLNKNNVESEFKEIDKGVQDVLYIANSPKTNTPVPRLNQRHTVSDMRLKFENSTNTDNANSFQNKSPNPIPKPKRSRLFKKSTSNESSEGSTSPTSPVKERKLMINS